MRTKLSVLMFGAGFVFQLSILITRVHSQTPFYQDKTLKIINNDPSGTAGVRVKGVEPRKFKSLAVSR